MPWALPVAIASAAGLEFWGMSEQAGAQTSAAQAQANAATQAAQIQAQSQQQALLFAEQQAQQNLISQNAIQQANYNQWAAQQQRIGALAQSYGYPARQIPAYVPIPGSQNPIPTSLAATTGTPTQTSSGAVANTVAPTTTSSGAVANTAVPPTTTTTTPSPTTGGTSGYQALINAINGGQSPQSAIAQYNQSQNLPTGASYAWRSIPSAPGGGVVELPNGQYLTPNPQGVWGIAGNPSSGSSGAASVGTPSGGARSATAALTTSPTLAAIGGSTGNSFLDYVLSQTGMPAQATVPTTTSYNPWSFPTTG